MIELRLKELILEKGITGKELSEKVGVSQNTITSINQGNSQPRFELLEKIAEVLDVDVRDLFKSTKDDNSETIYIKKNGEFTSIGRLKTI
jgi:transcriptional regulator with XRE-family HTH domain